MLCFHQVLPDRDSLRPDEPTVKEFAALVEGFRQRFDVLHLRDVPDFVASRRVGHGVVLTFDDGYENNFSLAAPVLDRLDVPATFFIATGSLDRGCMWNDLVIESIRELKVSFFNWHKVGIENAPLQSDADRLRLIERVIARLKYQSLTERTQLARELASMAELSEPPGLMMTPKEVKILDKNPLFEIGAHTISHPILASISDEEAKNEITDGKTNLESLLGRRVDLFAYPNGKPDKDFLLKHVAMVEAAGFELAVTTSRGGVRNGVPPLQWPRQTVWNTDPRRACLNLVRGAREQGVLVTR